MDPLLKILVSTLIVDALNEQCTEEEMAQKLKRKGLALSTEQIRNFISTHGAPQNIEAVQPLLQTSEVQQWA